MVKIRKITDIEEFKMLHEVQKSAWGIDDVEVEPHHFMSRIQKYGGLIQGLFLDNKIIGFSEAIIGKWQGEYFMYSHMVGVKSEYQGRGYGFMLKKAQGEEALKMGYHLIRWCFDPIESLNSFFNVHRLGVISREYERNVYGDGESGLFIGLPTDRLIATWELDSQRVKERMKKKLPLYIEEIPAENLETFDGDVAYIEIPRHIRLLKKGDLNSAREWRLKTRQSFESAFQKGFTAEEIIFSNDNKRIFYKLTNSHLE